MKTLTRFRIAVFALIAIAFAAGCASTGSTSSFAPVIAEIAQARIAKELLDRNPNAESKLLAIASALDVIAAEASGAEISELAIRTFVARRAEQWELTAPEQELLTLGLLAARDRFIASTGAASVITSDPRVGVWIGSIRRGIAAGVAAHKASK